MNWTNYVAEKSQERYKTGEVVTLNDYVRIKNDILNGTHKPPHHPNADLIFTDEKTWLRIQAAAELEWVWQTYYAPHYYQGYLNK